MCERRMTREGGSADFIPFGLFRFYTASEAWIQVELREKLDDTEDVFT